MSSLSDKSPVSKSSRSGSNRKRKKSSKIDRRLYLLIPLLLLGVIAVLSSNWRVQRDRQMAAVSAATATARTQAQIAMEATEEALLAQLAATEESRSTELAAIPTRVPTDIPTATSEPTAIPVVAATDVPTATPEPTATATATAIPEPTATTVPTLVPTPEPFSAEISTTYNLLTIRRGPDKNYSRLGSAVAGEPFTAIGQNATGDWIQICCVDGQNGWMATEFVTADVALDALPIVSAPDATVNNSSESVPLYSGPFYNFDLVETIPLNSTLVVTGRNPNGEWYQVCCSPDGNSGWVYSGSVLIDGSADLILEVSADE